MSSGKAPDAFHRLHSSVIDVVAVTPLLCEAVSFPLTEDPETSVEITIWMPQLLVGLLGSSELIAAIANTTTC